MKRILSIIIIILFLTSFSNITYGHSSYNFKNFSYERENNYRIISYQNGSLSGYINDSSSNPIEGALISINCGGLHQHNTTDSTGFYYIGDVPIVDCYWNVSASKKGYDTSWVDMPIDINSTYDFILTSSDIIYVGGNGPNNYSRIQDAIDNASNGDTVFVYNGIYQERIYVNKEIHLNGEDRNYTIIDGGKDGNVIYITKNFVSISNFTIQNRSIDEVHDGISLSYSYDISITDNNFIGCGISFDYLTPNIITYRANVKNNIVNGEPLIYFEGVINEIIDYPTGQIILSDCDNITISNQNISNLHNGIFLFHSNNCNLYKNKITDSAKGIVLYYSNYNNISENILSKNLIGILYGASNYTIFLKNILESNEKGIYDNIYPFVSGSNNIKIIKNIIRKNYVGINLVWFKPAFIRYNNVEDNSYIGIWIGSSSESFIEYNNFYRNRKDVYLIESIDTNNTIINENYWGRARIFPKIIYGKMRYGEGFFNIIPWIFFDRNPAKEPFDIADFVKY